MSQHHFLDGSYTVSSLCDPNKQWGCVAVRITPDAVFLRDTKFPETAPQQFTPEEWVTFLAGVKAGEFDLPVSAIE